MLFAPAFHQPNLLAWIRRCRDNPIGLYGTAIGLIAAATLARLSLHQHLSTTSPFTFYNLPILCMAFVGGFWPGAMTLALSSAVGAILFLPPAFSLTLAQGACWNLSVFALLGGIQVIVVSGLMASVLRHDEHQHFLIGELRHRSGNLFTLVRGIVVKTLEQSESTGRATEALETRLDALARTHTMLAANGWTGASLARIVSEELVAFPGQITRIGSDIELNTSAAQNFALIIHELATNAAKHGALSQHQGHVSIEVEISNSILRFVWSEIGGPKVRPPHRTGFGSSILIGMSKRFARNVKRTFRPEGLIYEMEVALAPILAPRPKTP